MPPLSRSSGHAVVPTGRRDVFSKTNPVRQHNKGQKPTTSKALVLRNGKYGSQGTGELMLLGRMTGREKLDLLAENLVEESKKAIMRPLNLEKCLKMAESQFDAYIDDIHDLHEADTFRVVMDAEMKSRADPTKAEPPRRTPSYIAKMVATRIHNSYMLASAWRIVSEMLNGLAIDGLTDKNVKAKLKADPAMRARYLVLFDIVKILVKMDQDRFAVLATTAPHYAKFFKLKQTEGSDPTQPEYVFDWKDLRDVTSSFLDSIIIELCFPRGTYPKAILYRILHDAVEESPKEAKRFPQALWDAVGDLSISIELQELLEAPLFGPEGEAWLKEPREMPEEYEAWVDAQIFSEKASNILGNFKDMVYPLEKTMHRKYLDEMWNQIDKNYVSVSGLDINSLWHLEDAFDVRPQWTAYAISKVHAGDDSDDEGPSHRPILKKAQKEQKLLRLAGESDSDDSMPGLQSVSNSDDDDDDDDSDSEYDSEADYESDESGGYNTDEEDEIRELWKEAMQAARDAEDLETPPDLNPFTADDRKGNPFLNLLGSLRGRMFNASPKLKTEETRTEPRAPTARRAFRATPSGAPKNVPTPTNLKAQPAPTPAKYATQQAPSSPAPPKSQKATVEEVEDEDDIAAAAAKKKKKKSKKKKKPSSATGGAPASPSPSAQSMESLASTPTKTTPASSLKPSMPSSASSFSASMASLSIETPTAQSGHSYLRSLGIGAGADKKVKSRPDHASLFSNPEKEKKKGGLFSSSKNKEKTEDVDTKEAAQSWFNKLTKKTTGLMSQLLNTKEESKGGMGSMKWEHFLRVMREMGFDYDPSTAGSSVRFDPPNKNDPPITFHKPHPDPTLQPHMIRVFGKRLQRKYGWSDEYIKNISGAAF